MSVHSRECFFNFLFDQVYYENNKIGVGIDPRTGKSYFKIQEKSIWRRLFAFNQHDFKIQQSSMGF